MRVLGARVTHECWVRVCAVPTTTSRVPGSRKLVAPGGGPHARLCEGLCRSDNSNLSMLQSWLQAEQVCEPPHQVPATRSQRHHRSASMRHDVITDAPPPPLPPNMHNSRQDCHTISLIMH
jgi:hypothetical protein